MLEGLTNEVECTQYRSENGRLIGVSKYKTAEKLPGSFETGFESISQAD